MQLSHMCNLELYKYKTDTVYTTGTTDTMASFLIRIRRIP